MQANDGKLTVLRRPIRISPFSFSSCLRARDDDVDTTKADWIETSNTKACSHGFRLYVGEGRALKTKKPSATSGRLELACWKYRGKDAQGRRTRAGGCRFKLKGREVESSDGSAQWQLVGGIFVRLLRFFRARSPGAC